MPSITNSCSSFSLLIGVCTYRRPSLLVTCLDSLQALRIPSELSISLLVVDNDPSGSAAPVVRDYSSSPVPVEYVKESQRGIPFARNRVLRWAEESRATYVAFIDDDEWAHPQWVQELWCHIASSGVEVVRGFVQMVYPADAPAWAVRNQVYQQKNYETGTRFATAATSNVLFSAMRVVTDWGIYFDERFGLSGGSDTDFFSRVTAAGGEIHHVANAITYEEVQPFRLRRSWYLRRSFRAANEPAKYSGMPLAGKMKLLLRSGAAIVRSISWYLACRYRDPDGALPHAVRLTRAVGRTLALMGLRISWSEYDRS